MDEEQKKLKEMTDGEREQAMYTLAMDVSNMRVNQVEANAYANTVQHMIDNKIDTLTSNDGVMYGKEYYEEKYLQFWWHSKAQNININRLMIQRGIKISELNEFMQSKLNPTS
jgi:NADP-dependent 3-hydroxy acid dehydrogenase YdfG